MRRRGLTVVEVLMAVAIFVTAMIAVLGVFPASTKAARQSEAALTALELAQREMEISKTQSYDSINARTVTYQMYADHNGVQVTTEYDLAVAVAEPKPGLKHLSVTCTYYAPDQNGHSTTLETNVAKLSP